MNRRDALQRMMTVTGTVLIGAEFFLSGCSRPAPGRAVSFSPEEIATLDEIADTIIPTTTTPGAKAAAVGRFMADVVRDCYDDASYALFRNGIASVDKVAQKRFGKPFVQVSASDRTALLNELDAEQKAHTKNRKAGDGPHYFTLMKNLTLLGYFSSEIGSTKALRYVESPGSYNGDVPYKKGDRGYFNPSRRVS
ncbi:MAG: gluconate 2-dehydrogenase subunit 3 family protein [Gemmatimonadaceae bacterium]